MVHEQVVDGQALRFDNPEAYIPRDRRWALARGERMADRVHGAGLFADVSGFTPLTEALANELGPQRGAEMLTAILDEVTSAVIAELHRFGGDVIYFSGDAITGWIDGDDGSRATACALAMQATMARVGSVVTPGGTELTLAMKVAIAVGAARRFVVGLPKVQLIDVLAGRLVDNLAETEHHAQKGEVLLDPSARAALGDRVELAELRADETTGREFGVVRRLTIEVEDRPVAEPPALPESVVRQWLLPAVFERMRTGRGEFLAELRAAYPLFLRFGGIDYDDDDEADVKLDAFVVKAQEILDGYGGNVLQLTLGDKGAYLYGVFGSPLAHEDDAARATAAALELRELGSSTAATDLQIGIAHGRLRSGTYGHPDRRTFVCLGDAVNLSARLMSAAPVGGIYVSRGVHDEAGDAFTWAALEPMRVKGKAEPVEVFALNRSVARISRRQVRYELPLVGRRAELAELDRTLDEVRLGRGRVVGIAAEAGMGKSRLVAEFVRAARRAGLTVAFGECQAFGTTMAYLPWREVWRNLFGLDDPEGLTRAEVSDDPARERASVERALAGVDPGLVARAPLLEAVLGVAIPDNDLTSAFDPKLRKASLEDLLARCLTANATRPLVIVLEDCHWIDELSKSLLEALVRASATAPVLFVLAYRPGASIGGDLGLERLPQFGEISLSTLDATETAALIRSKLGQLTGTDAEAPGSLVELIAGRAEGNPFYVEEFLNFLVGRGIDPADSGAISTLELPNSLQSLILSRIDRLDEAPRRTLKVASVVGRVFHAPVLPRVYAEIGSVDEVTGQLNELRREDLVALDREAEQAYLFRHVLMQTVAYESMPFELRSLLHEHVAADIERTEAGHLDRHLDLLAHHYWHGRDEAKKREYLWRAAEAAHAAHANESAIVYFDRLIPLLSGSERARAMLVLAKAHELTGNWTQASELDGDVRDLAIEIGDRRVEARAIAALAEVSRKQGRYDEASTELLSAAALFEALDDDRGTGEVLHLAGTVAAQRGDYDTARQRYGDSLVIRRRHDDRDQIARLLANLAIVAEYEGDFDESRRLNLEALAIREALGDRWVIAMSHNNLGMIALHQQNFREASDRFEESIRLGREVGDPWVLALGEENQGNAQMGLGELAGARASYASALGGFLALGDRYYSAFLLERIALLAAALGSCERAFELTGAADRLRDEMGAGRAPSLVDEIDRGLQSARVALGPEAAAAAQERGRTWSLEQAVGPALEVCEGQPTAP